MKPKKRKKSQSPVVNGSAGKRKRGALLGSKNLAQENFAFEEKKLREREQRERERSERRRDRSSSEGFNVPSEEGQLRKVVTREVQSIRNYLDHCIKTYKEVEKVPSAEASIPEFNAAEDVAPERPGNATHTRFRSFLGNDITGIS